MTKALTQELDNLKAALTALKPIGHDGFEGLLAAIFSSISNHPFRLAGSGSQHGKDGSGTVETRTIAFEAKLYKGKIDKNEVLSKLTEIVASYPTPDLWVLGATIEIKTQITDPLERVAKKNGINFLLLDWPPTSPIPDLAVLCAVAKDQTIDFLEEAVSDQKKVKLAADALAKIRAHPSFEASSQRILAFLRNPVLGPAIAQDANSQWLRTAFSDQRIARLQFGQQLSPLADHALPAVAREDLLGKLGSAAFGPPKDEMIVLLGGEGCGKSWIFAQTWAAQYFPPLTLVIPASEIPKGLTITNEFDFLIQQIVRHTDGTADEHAIQRWRNVIEHWSSQAMHAEPNLVVFVDGLNQCPDYCWATWLDAMAYKLAEVCGRLVVSVRKGYFDTRLRDALTTPLRIISVEEWTETELRAILSERGVAAQNLSAKVMKTLCNPRVLGIAFDLLKDGSIKDFDELSVERLLFQHIRKSSLDQNSTEIPLVFTKRLSAHANDVLERVKAERANDTMIFESADLSSGSPHALTQDLLAVSEGKFFRALPDDPYLYELTDDGLILALGFAILDAMKSGLRNYTSANEALDTMLEPISALDKTADAVNAALLVSSVDKTAKDSTVSALIAAYLRLQNIDENSYPAFEAVVRSRINAAMEALKELATSGSYAANDEWLTLALREMRDDAEAWRIMSGHINSWLQYFSLDPAVGLFKRDDEGKEKYDEKLAEREELLATRIGDLSVAEAEFFATKMKRDDRLANSAIAAKVFRLLSGMALEEFTESLVAWAFGHAINSDFHCPYDEFLYLVRFNIMDWAQTRVALLSHAAPLASQETSNAGKWAYVHLLRATTTLSDAQRCRELVDDLTRDREKFEGWRLIEEYCATDPCDPASERPENIDQTVQDYQAIELDNLLISLGMTAEDHFLQDASYGLARFESKTAITVHRAVIEKFSITVTNPTKYRFLGLRKNTALFTDTSRELLLELARSKSRANSSQDQESRDDWILAQYSLLMSFPHMSGDEQLDALLSLNAYGPPLLDLADVLKTATPEALEKALDRCVKSADPYFKMTILMVARYSGTAMNERSIVSLRALAEEGNSRVRSLAIGTLVDSDDSEFIKAFAESEWNANTLDSRENHFERWDGARAIAKAYAKGLLSEADAIERVACEHYQLLASVDNEADFAEIRKRLNASVAKMLDIELPLVAPTIEQLSGERRKAFHTPMRSIVEPKELLDPQDFFKRMSECEEEFDARQARGRKAFDEFETTLTKHDARQIIDDTALITLRACSRSAPNLLPGWADTFLQHSGQKIRHIYNFGLRVAEALSHDDPELAARLFRHLRDNRGFVNIVHGPAALGLESLSIWNAADKEAINLLRAARLDEAATDHAIAQEVLAAHSAGRSEFLDDYIEKKLQCDEPANVARALMVCGFALAEAKREAIIAENLQLPGLIGKAAKTAQYAYERNVWARHWYDAMRSAETNEDFWSFSVLFLKVVDGRYQSWGKIEQPCGKPMENFEPSVWREIERRIKKWEDKRTKKLFGEKAPARFFLFKEKLARANMAL